jgi:hypothetical protein
LNKKKLIKKHQNQTRDTKSKKTET